MINKIKNTKRNNTLKNKAKSSNGITLISLIITIIVLLILAGISISLLTGDNGILSQASNAKEKTRIGEINELKTLWLYERRIAEEAGEEVKSLNTFLSELVQKGHITNEEKTQIETNKKLEIGDTIIVFEEDIVVVEPDNPEDWNFISNGDGTITITNYLGDDTEVIIPNYIGGFPVKAIKPTSGRFSATDNRGGLISLWDYSIRRK